MFKVTIARILTNYPAKTFRVVASDITSAQIRVWRKVKKWHHIISAANDVCPACNGQEVLIADNGALLDCHVCEQRENAMPTANL